MRRTLATLIVLIVALGLPMSQVPIARAAPTTDADARRAFELGRDAYDRGHFAEALAHFEQAYALSHKPQLLFNIARAADAEGLGARALASYEQYLKEAPDAANRGFVEGRVDKLRAQLAAPDATALPEEAADAPTDPEAPPVAIAITPTRERESAPVASAEPAPVLPPVALPADAPLVVPGPGASETTRDDRATRPLWKRPWLWVAVGGVAVVGSAIAIGLAAARRGDDERVAADARFSTLEVR